MPTIFQSKLSIPNQFLILEFEQNLYLKGLEFITPIYNAILYKKPLKVSYRGFKQEKKVEIRARMNQSQKEPNARASTTCFPPKRFICQKKNRKKKL